MGWILKNGDIVHPKERSRGELVAPLPSTPGQLVELWPEDAKPKEAKL